MNTAPLTGQNLFKLWVQNGLCNDRQYMWPQLSELSQKCWDNFAARVREEMVWTNDQPHP
jgi:hypothetical protein